MSTLETLQINVQNGWLEEPLQAMNRNEYWFNSLPPGSTSLTGVDTSLSPNERYVRIRNKIRMAPIPNIQTEDIIGDMTDEEIFNLMNIAGLEFTTDIETNSYEDSNN